MPIWISIILDFMKVGIPPLMVYLAVQYVLREFLQNQYQTQLLKFQTENKRASMPIRFQAYERLALLCERISLPNLIFRLQSQEMSAADLKSSMVVAIQQEFEHNVSQQVYVSSELWRIILKARDTNVRLIHEAYSNLPENASQDMLAGMLLQFVEQQGDTPSDAALHAIRHEMSFIY